MIIFAVSESRTVVSSSLTLIHIDAITTSHVETITAITKETAISIGAISIGWTVTYISAFVNITTFETITFPTTRT